jgi:hypothetical protein
MIQYLVVSLVFTLSLVQCQSGNKERTLPNIYNELYQSVTHKSKLFRSFQSLKRDQNQWVPQTIMLPMTVGGNLELLFSIVINIKLMFLYGQNTGHSMRIIPKLLFILGIIYIRYIIYFRYINSFSSSSKKNLYLLYLPHLPHLPHLNRSPYGPDATENMAYLFLPYDFAIVMQNDRGKY